MNGRDEVSSCAAVALTLALLLGACSAKPEVPKAPPRDPTLEAWYGAATVELTKLADEAKLDFKRGKLEAASTLIEHGETVSARLLAVPRPSLAALEAVSDVDELYGQMLFRNRHYGWARLQFQKNLARWKHFQPASTSSTDRAARAQAQMEQCDRAMERQGTPR